MTSRPTQARTLTDLGELRAAIRKREREAAERERLAQQRAEQSRRERELFATSVGPVLPLRRPAAAPIARSQPTPEPRQRERDERAVLAESIADGFDVESLLDTDDALSFRRRGIGPEVVRKLRRGVWAIQAQLDLHGLRRDAAREQLTAFLREAQRNGARCVRVVHGKGNGSPGRTPVLKAKVRAWLAQSNGVIAFAQARAADGGTGAMLVLLQPPQRSAPQRA